MDNTQLHAPQGAGRHRAGGSLPPWDDIGEAYLSVAYMYGPVDWLRVIIIGGDGQPTPATGYSLDESGAWVTDGVPQVFPGGLPNDHRLLYSLPEGCQGVAVDWSSTSEECTPAIHLLTIRKL